MYTTCRQQISPIRMIKRLFFGTIALCMLSCNSNTPQEVSAAAADATYLTFPDSLFAFHNFDNTASISQFDWEGYTDSTKTKRLVRIDSMTVVKLLCPLNVIKPGEYSYFMKSFYYISKQPLIADIQPIIIWGNSDDYSELICLTLDKNGKPLDHYVLYENNCSGTDMVEDSLMAICPIQHSLINADIITTYVNNVCFRVDTVNQTTMDDFARVDSISYESTILPSGKIETRKVDSVRFHRIYTL